MQTSIPGREDPLQYSSLLPNKRRNPSDHFLFIYFFVLVTEPGRAIPFNLESPPPVTVLVLF